MGACWVPCVVVACVSGVLCPHGDGLAESAAFYGSPLLLGSTETQPFPLDPLRLSSSRELRITPQAEGGAGLAGQLADALWRVPCPVVVWTDPELRVGEEVSIPRGTYREQLDELATTLGPYRVICHSGFVELAWAAADRESQVRSRMRSEVPPMAIRADSPGRAILMWERVSGADVLCSAKVVGPWLDGSGSSAEAGLPPWHSSAPGGQGMGVAGPQIVPGPLVATCEPMGLGRFLDRLALDCGGAAREVDGTWLIGEFRRDARGVATIRELVRALAAGPPRRGDMDPSVVLRRLGRAALPELLEAFETSEWPYRAALVRVLRSAPSPERDAAFILALRYDLASDTRTWGNPSPECSSMIEALGESGCSAAIPLIRQCSFRWPGPAPVVALNLLGHPLPARDAETLVLAEGTAPDTLEQPVGRAAAEVLTAVVDQCRITDLVGPLRLTSVSTESDSVRLAGHWPLGQWQAYVAVDSPGGPVWASTGAGGAAGLTDARGQPLRRATARVGFAYLGGPGVGSGCDGLAELRDGRWLLTKWVRRWAT
jgi:hypothetical protein